MTDHDEARLLAESFVNGSNHAWGDADQLHYIDRDGNVCALTGAGARIIASALLAAPRGTCGTCRHLHEDTGHVVGGGPQSPWCVSLQKYVPGGDWFCADHQPADATEGR